MASNPGADIRVLDLFAGCGGISLGFASAGFRIVAAAEIDPLAARSHAVNFLQGAEEAEVEHHARPRDLTTTDPDELAADLGLGSEDEAIDVIVGGPRCQAYALVGRPKLREIAEHPEAFRIRFPRATYRCDLPPGYSGTRSVALRLVDRSGAGRYVAPDTGHAELPPAVTAAEAIGDLPAITLHRRGLLRRGARRFDELARYHGSDLEAIPAYARLMRSWPGFESREGVFDHVIRFLPRDTESFEAMSPGDEYPAAHRVARRLFEEEAKRNA